MEITDRLLILRDKFSKGVRIEVDEETIRVTGFDPLAVLVGSSAPSAEIVDASPIMAREFVSDLLLIADNGDRVDPLDVIEAQIDASNAEIQAGYIVTGEEAELAGNERASVKAR